MNAKDLTKDERKALLISKEHTEYVIEPAALDPLLTAYEHSNKSLKVELATLKSDTARLSDLLEMMIRDNTELRQFINKKNNDMGKMMATLAQEEGEYVSGLKDNIAIIEEENRHLVFQVERLEEQLDREKMLNLDAEDHIHDGKKINRRMNEDLRELQLRDKTNAEKLHILESQNDKLQEKLEKEIIAKEKAEKELQRMRTLNLDQTKKGLGSQIEDQFVDNEKYTELLQEVVLLREENKYANDQLKHYLKQVKTKESPYLYRSNVNKHPGDIPGANKANSALAEAAEKFSRIPKTQLEKLQKDLKKAETDKEKFKKLYENGKKKLKLMEQMKDVDQDRGSIFSQGLKKMAENLVASGGGNSLNQRGGLGGPADPSEVAQLKADLLMKTNLLEVQRQEHKKYLGEVERMNQELAEKMRAENYKLKREKSELMAKLDSLMEKNLSASKKLDRAQLFMQNDASMVKIKCLKEDNDLLRRQLSDLRRGGNASINLSNKLLQMKNELTKKDRDHKEALKKLHAEAVKAEGEKVNLQHHITVQQQAINKLHSGLNKKKMDVNKLSAYIHKLVKALDSQGAQAPQFDPALSIPDSMLKDMQRGGLISDSEGGHEENSSKPERSKADIQNELRKSHHRADSQSDPQGTVFDPIQLNGSNNRNGAQRNPNVGQGRSQTPRSQPFATGNGRNPNNLTINVGNGQTPLNPPNGGRGNFQTPGNIQNPNQGNQQMTGNPSQARGNGQPPRNPGATQGGGAPPRNPSANRGNGLTPRGQNRVRFDPRSLSPTNKYKLPNGKILTEEEYQQLLKTKNLTEIAKEVLPGYNQTGQTPQGVIQAQNNYAATGPSFYTNRPNQRTRNLPPATRRVASSRNLFPVQTTQGFIGSARNRSNSFSGSQEVRRNGYRRHSGMRGYSPVYPRDDFLEDENPNQVARDIVRQARVNILGDFGGIDDPLMTTVSSKLTHGGVSLPQDYRGGPVNSLIQRYNQTDLYNK